MSCEKCPEPVPGAPVVSEGNFHIMPQNAGLVQLASLLRRANLTVSDDCIIESETPIEGLRKDGNHYHLDWVTCSWKMIHIQMPKIKVSCVRQLDVNSCASCPNRHTS